MTGQSLKDFTDSLVNDTSNETWFLGALNAQKNRIQEMRDWEFLKVLDSSMTHNAGSTYTTTHTLPTYFGRPLKLSVGTETEYRSLIDLENSRLLRDQSGSWFIDWAAGTFSLTGTEGTGGTIYLLYAKTTADLTLLTSPVWPDRFQRALAFFVAADWFAQDGSEKSFSWAAEMRASGEQLLSAMTHWDERIKVMAANSSGTPLDTSNVPYIA